MNEKGKKNKLLLNHLRQNTKALVLASETAGLAKSTTNIGAAREGIISLFLKRNLPDAFNYHTGEVCDYKGNRSGQCDIILVPDSSPKMHLGGAINIFPIETILGVIEVKTELTECEIKRIGEHCAKFRFLTSLEPNRQGRFRDWSYGPRPYFVFAYGGLTTDSACKKFKENESLPDLVVNLKRDYSLACNWSTHQISIIKKDCMAFLYARLMKLVEFWMKHPEQFFMPVDSYTKDLPTLDDLFIF